MEQKSNIRKLKTIMEGLLGYYVYLSKCNVSEAYSEYLFYEPMIRMMNNKGKYVKSEVVVVFPEKETKKKGDKARIDFVLYEKNGKGSISPSFAIEMKYFKKIPFGLKNKLVWDAEKLKRFEINSKCSIDKFILILYSGAKDKNLRKQIKTTSLKQPLRTIETTVSNKTYKIDLLQVI